MTSLDITATLPVVVPAPLAARARREGPVFTEVRQARRQRWLARFALVTGIVAVTATALGMLLLLL
jgi:hypothetical protein